MAVEAAAGSKQVYSCSTLAGLRYKVGPSAFNMEGNSSMEGGDSRAPSRMSQPVQGLGNSLQNYQYVRYMPEFQVAASPSTPPNGAAASSSTALNDAAALPPPTRKLYTNVAMWGKPLTDPTSAWRLMPPYGRPASSTASTEPFGKVVTYPQRPSDPTPASTSSTAPNEAAASFTTTRKPFGEVVVFAEQPTDPTPSSAEVTSKRETPKAHISQRRNPMRLAKRARQDTQTGFRLLPGHQIEVKIWRTFPEDLVEMVFARLPVRRIVELIRDSEAWSNMSKSTNFRQVCIEKHPCSLFCLMRWDTASVEGDSVRATVYDLQSNEWAGFDLAGFPASARCTPADEIHHNYEESMYGHDSGLVCFVPPVDLAVAPVLVCNPLTGDWRSLPLIPDEHMPTLVVQLLVDDAKKTYKIMLVNGRVQMKRDIGYVQVKRIRLCVTNNPGNTARCYDSSTGAWSLMNTGWIHGSGGTLQQCHTVVPRVFDCEKKVMYHLRYDVPLTQPYCWSIVKENLVVASLDNKGISEFAWTGYYSIRSTIAMLRTPLNAKPPHQVFIFSSTNFNVMIGNSNMMVHGSNCQIIQVYDRSTSKWILTSSMPSIENLDSRSLRQAFCCELRWDAIP